MAALFEGSNATGARWKYLWLDRESGGRKVFIYVTADAPATVDGSGYFSNTTIAGYKDNLASMRPGDIIESYQLGTLTTDQPPYAVGGTDNATKYNMLAAANISDYSLHIVTSNTGTTIDVSTQLVDLTVASGD